MNVVRVFFFRPNIYFSGASPTPPSISWGSARRLPLLGVVCARFIQTPVALFSSSRVVYFPPNFQYHWESLWRRAPTNHPPPTCEEMSGRFASPHRMSRSTCSSGGNVSSFEINIAVLGQLGVGKSGEIIFLSLQKMRLFLFVRSHTQPLLSSTSPGGGLWNTIHSTVWYHF